MTTFKTATGKNSKPQPLTHDGRCYACDAAITGLAANGAPACARHSDHRVRVYKACAYCTGRRPGLVIEGRHVHVSCYKADCAA